MSSERLAAKVKTPQVRREAAGVSVGQDYGLVFTRHRRGQEEDVNLVITGLTLGFQRSITRVDGLRRIGTEE